MDHLDNKLSIMLDEISVEKEMKAAKDTEAMNAAETEVAAHMERVIEDAKTTDGWDISDVVNKVNGHVSKVLNAHGFDDVAKEKSIEHLDNKLSKMLEEISVEKEMEPANDAKTMMAAETEVAAHMDAVIERAKATDGWDINDVVSKVDVGVNKILDAHGIDGVMKEKAIDHLDNKLSEVLEEISLAKESEQEVSTEAMDAAESEVAAHMDAVIERAKATDGWDISDVVSKVDVGVSKILDTHGIDGAAKERAIEHLDDKLFQPLEEISVEKELQPAKDNEAMKAAETEVAAHRKRVIEHLDDKLFQTLEEIS